MIPCKNPRCDQMVDDTPQPGGHRRREYHNDACRATAHRYHKKQARLAAEATAREARITEEIRTLRQKYPRFSLATIKMLRDLNNHDHYGPALAEQVGRAIAREREEAQRSATEERNALVEDILLAGELLSFPALCMLEESSDDVGHEYTLEAGLEAWTYLASHAGPERLRLVADAAHCKLLAAQGRQRLATLA